MRCCVALDLNRFRIVLSNATRASMPTALIFGDWPMPTSRKRPNSNPKWAKQCFDQRNMAMPAASDRLLNGRNTRAGNTIQRKKTYSRRDADRHSGAGYDP